jgi:hypothetical protein
MPSFRPAGPGYDDTMTDEPTKPGPANPAPEGVDVPTPPGGPQRQDAPDTEHVPGRPEPDEDAGAMDPEVREAQEENAASSLDQPSDNSGAE